MREVTATRVCSKCGEAKSESEMRSPRQSACRACFNAYERERYRRLKNDPEWVERERARHRAKARRQWHEGNGKRNALRYRLKQLGVDLTLDEFDRLKAEQGGVCAICNQPCDKGGELAVDHCHTTGAVRGLLCRNCNVGLGYFRDNPSLLVAASRYLTQTQEG